VLKLLSTAFKKKEKWVNFRVDLVDPGQPIKPETRPLGLVNSRAGFNNFGLNVLKFRYMFFLFFFFVFCFFFPKIIFFFFLFFSFLCFFFKIIFVDFIFLLLNWLRI
jgi:hypothetical protein